MFKFPYFWIIARYSFTLINFDIDSDTVIFLAQFSCISLTAYCIFRRAKFHSWISSLACLFHTLNLHFLVLIFPIYLSALLFPNLFPSLTGLFPSFGSPFFHHSLITLPHSSISFSLNSHFFTCTSYFLASLYLFAPLKTSFSHPIISGFPLCFSPSSSWGPRLLILCHSASSFLELSVCQKGFFSYLKTSTERKEGLNDLYFRVLLEGFLQSHSFLIYHWISCQLEYLSIFIGFS